jgi:integrase
MGRYVGMRRKSNGSWEKRFTVNGKRYSVCAETQKKAEELADKRKAEIKNGNYKPSSSVTLSQYFDGEFIRFYTETVKPNTIFAYRRIFDFDIRLKIGDTKITGIERRMIKLLMEKISKAKSVYAANNVLKVLKLVLKSAEEDEIITKSPISDMKPLKRTPSSIHEKSHRALTREETDIFFKYEKSELYYNFYRFMLNTGLRGGEASALEWRDIDLKNMVIHVRRTITRLVDGKIAIGDTPKTTKSNRDIPINTEIMKILHSQRELYLALFGSKTENIAARVFSMTNGGIITIQNSNSRIRWLVKRINKDGIDFEPFSTHAFRVTFATRAAESGMDMNVLKEILGHSSYQMTADLYSHVYKDRKVESMKNLAF